MNRLRNCQRTKLKGINFNWVFQVTVLKSVLSTQDWGIVLLGLLDRAGLPVCLSACLPVCLSVCAPAPGLGLCSGEVGPRVRVRQGGQAVWGKGKETSGACGWPSGCGQGLVWGAAKWCFLVLFEIKIPFLLNYPSMAHITGQVLFHHILS